MEKQKRYTQEMICSGGKGASLGIQREAGTHVRTAILQARKNQEESLSWIREKRKRGSRAIHGAEGSKGGLYAESDAVFTSQS